MSNIGFRIRSSFKRPPRELVERFRGLPVANIADCMNRISCLDVGIIPFNRTPLIGCAFTVRSTGGDNLLFHKALDTAQPGDVIVAADGGTLNRSCCGEIMVRYAMSKGLAGFIVDACIRDAYAIGELDFPVYARGATPNGPYKNGPGEINFPVSCGGIVIDPGDIVIGDGDGVVVIKPEQAVEIAEIARKVFQKEEKSMEDISAGKGLDRAWVDELLKAKNVEFVD
jgi:regulator of RNase E activity RraA